MGAASMTDFISGASKLLIGGIFVIVFGGVALRSIWDKRTRDDFLSYPHLRNPTILHKVGFAVIAGVALVAMGMVVASGFSDLAKALS